MVYAENTTVSPEKSQSQISETLRKYGANGFMYGWEGNQAMVAFRAHDRHIKFLLPLPDENDPKFYTSPGGRSRTEKAAQEAYEQVLRTRWRALLLAIKAKLEAVETGITTFEEEFMAHIVLPDGGTVADHLLPEIEKAYRTGGMPGKLLPPSATRKAIEA
jgi:hypothetical protein